MVVALSDIRIENILSVTNFRVSIILAGIIMEYPGDGKRCVEWKGHYRKGGSCNVIY